MADVTKPVEKGCEGGGTESGRGNRTRERAIGWPMTGGAKGAAKRVRCARLLLIPRNGSINETVGQTNPRARDCIEETIGYLLAKAAAAERRGGGEGGGWNSVGRWRPLRRNSWRGEVPRMTSSSAHVAGEILPPFRRSPDGTETRQEKGRKLVSEIRTVSRIINEITE